VPTFYTVTVRVRLRVPAVDDPDLLAEMSHGEVAVLRLVGSADTAAIEPLGALLRTIHDELIARATPEIVVDVRGLDLMSAGCLRQLLAWLARVHETALEQRYQIRIRVNPAIGWQQHSLHALSCFDTETISVES
jgi:hypothetical protein